MPGEVVEHVEVAPEGFQGPSLVAEAALAPNKSTEPDRRLVDGELLAENEIFFGSSGDGVHWTWTFHRATGGQEEQQSEGARRTVSLVEPIRNGDRAHPSRAQVLDHDGELEATPWAGQPEQGLQDGLNAAERRWRRSRQMRQAVPVGSGFRFVAEEELTGRIDEIHRDVGTASCTVWRRRADHDPFDAEIVLAEFPQTQTALVAEGAFFYWTFGWVIHSDGKTWSVSDIALQRPTPIPPEQWELARERARRRAARYHQLGEYPHSSNGR